jgi:hypothetical protein
MKVVDLVKFSGEMLKTLHNFGIHIDDYRYLPLYSDYEVMANDGEKMTYIVATLCQKYGLCERKIYKVLKHFKTECHLCAV